MLQHTVHALQSELDNLRADNIKLYEKIKFLQSYPGRVSVRLSVCPSVRPSSGWAHAGGQTPDTETAHFQHAACMKAGANWGGKRCSALSRGAGTQPPCQEGSLELC